MSAGRITLKQLCLLYQEHNTRSDKTICFRKCFTRIVCNAFGPKRLVELIRSQDWDNFARYLVEVRRRNKALSATYRYRLQIAFASLMKFALNRGDILRNPFAGARLPAPPVAKNRAFFVTPELYAEAMAILPPDLKVVLALARYGGLRVPSEARLVRWGDVDWKNQELFVRSPKTEYWGKFARTIPLFAELRPVLRQRRREIRQKFGKVDPAETILNRHTLAATWDRQARRAFEKHNKKPWPKLWINCRSSRVTELMALCGPNTFDFTDVAAWMGHSANVMIEHYKQESATARRRAATAILAIAKS